ncbi:hypothetical protein RIF29_07261 [Crotalaria pallida]|uniref:Uncharacterized protein n=1 Tax=Crotalaria pallida TaxID=3830 RepID=A0AAN9PBB3_CROPI
MLPTGTCCTTSSFIGQFWLGFGFRTSKMPRQFVILFCYTVRHLYSGYLIELIKLVDPYTAMVKALSRHRACDALNPCKGASDMGLSLTNSLIQSLVPLYHSYLLVLLNYFNFLPSFPSHAQSASRISLLSSSCGYLKPKALVLKITQELYAVEASLEEMMAAS